MIIVQGAFNISPIHDRPLQIGERMEEEEQEEEVVVEEEEEVVEEEDQEEQEEKQEEEEQQEEEEEQGRGGVFDKYIFRPPALWWFTQPLVLGV